MGTTVVIRQWGGAWHVRSQGSSTTTQSFMDALSWAAGSLEPGGEPVTIRWGHPVEEGEIP